MIGNSMSLTVMVCVHFFTFPYASVAFHSIEVVPLGKAAVISCPSLRVPVTVGVPQLSVAVGGLIATVAEHKPVVVFTTTLDGQVITGNSPSIILIVCVQVLVLPCASVAVHVIVVVPIE